MSDTKTTIPDAPFDLTEIPRDELESGLKVLGAPNFVRKGFPLLGLLATVYEHVSTRVGPMTDDAPESFDEPDDDEAEPRNEE